MLSFIGQKVHKCFSCLERCLTRVALSKTCYKRLKLAVLSDGAAFTTYTTYCIPLGYLVVVLYKGCG